MGVSLLGDSAGLLRARALAIAPLVVILGALFCYALPTVAHGAWTIEYLDTEVVPKATGFATTTITFPSEIVGNSYYGQFYVKNLPTENNYYNHVNGNHCYPLNGGSGSFTASSTYNHKASQTQTSNTALGAVACNTTGTYYHIFRDATASSTILYVAPYYYNVTENTYSGALVYQANGDGITINYNSQYDTRFTHIDFASSTNSVDFDVAYYVDPTEATTTQADKNPTLVRVQYSKVPTQTTEANGYTLNVNAPAWGYGTSSVSLSLDASSTYDVRVSFANGGTVITGIAPFPLAYVYFTVTTDGSGGIATTSRVENYNAVTTQKQIYQECSLTNITGCIINAGVFLFVPSYESIGELTELKEDLYSRVPFIYVAETPDLWNSLWNQTGTSLSVSASTSIGSISFISEQQLEAIPLTATVRTIVGYLLWFMLALTLYARVRSVFNHQERV